MSQPRILDVRQKILSKNDQLADELRADFAANYVFVANVVSSPGSGKTELLSLALTELNKDYSTAAVTGDLATENDADRLAVTGAKSRQILTGTMCHLETDLVADAISDWDMADLDFLFIENVGNLVCPSGFDLGEDVRVMLISTTEGEDKPLKYPTMTNTADVIVINKMDIAEAVDCDVEKLESNIREVRPDAVIFRVSAKTGAGVDEWIDYMKKLHAQKMAAVAEA